jgi:chromosome segregation ATPase
MRRVLTLVTATLFTLGIAGGAAAQTEVEPLTTTSVVAPDSPLFFIQHLLDGWEEFIAFDEAQKAAVLAKIADNRLAEAALMIAAGNAERAAELIEDMEDALAKAADKIAKIQEKLEEIAAELEEDTDEDGEQTDQRRTEENVVDHVMSRLQRNLERQAEQREKVLENVTNERAREAITSAMERSKKGLENEIGRAHV